MANLDTRSKRASSVALLIWSTLAPVLPDNTISQGDRQHIAHTYSGILASAIAGTSPDRIWPIDAEVRVWAISSEIRTWAIDSEVRVYEVTD